MGGTNYGWRCREGAACATTCPATTGCDCPSGTAGMVDPIHDYGGRFNLGRTTGIDLPGESRGVLPSDEWKRRQVGERGYPGDTLSVAIGQGLLAVTPVQMAAMMSAVATQGRIPTPHLIRGTADAPRRIEVQPRSFEIVRSALREARLHTN